MSSPPGSVTPRRWALAAHGYAVIVALGLAYFLVRMPYQVSDDLDHILMMQAYPSFGAVLQDMVADDQGTLRPVMWLQQKVLFDIAPGDRHLATYKAFNLAQLVVMVLLFVRLLRVRSAIDFVALPLALVALFGMHTFNSTVREGYPVNHFMTILVCCLAAVNLAFSRPGWWRDIAAVLIFAYAALTIETGLLVWVCLVAAYAAGGRGVSWKGVAAATILLGGYFILRFGVLDAGSRSLASMSSGYGFSVRSTDTIVELFGDAPWKFYLYNIVSAGLTVLFSEPRAGVFQFASFVAVDGVIPPWSLVNVIASSIGTALIGAHVCRRVKAWRHRRFEHDDGILLVFLAVLAANATISFPYLKDVVMSPAGMFYAAALFVATRDLLRRLAEPPQHVAAVLVAIPLVLLSAGWTLRAARLVETIRETAIVNRNDWAVAEQREDSAHADWRSRHPDAEALLQRLRAEVILMPVPQPYTIPRWTQRWFEPY